LNDVIIKVLAGHLSVIVPYCVLFFYCRFLLFWERQC